MDKSKVLLAFIAIVFSFGVVTSSFANGRFIAPPPCPKSCLDGGYIGVGSGAVNAWSGVESSYNVYTTLGDLTSAYDFKLGEYGFNANIFAGYGKQFYSLYYFGMEIFANYFNPKMEGFHSYVTSTGTYDLNMRTKVENSYSFGSDARIGYMVSSRMMIYALFGLDYAKFNVENKAVDSGTAAASNKLITNKFEKWKMGYMPGIGIETCLNDHMTLRVQYSYTFYDSFNYSTSFEDPEGFGGPTIVSLKTKVSPHRNMLTLMLAFK